jgi:hypothetical protein
MSGQALAVAPPCRSAPALHDWARSWAFDLKAGVDQSLEDDFSRGAPVSVAVEQVGQHMPWGEFDHALPQQ